MNIEEARRIVAERITSRLNDDPQRAADIGKAVALEVTGEFTGRWVVDCREVPAMVRETEDGDAEATIRLDSKALEGMLSGDISPAQAFMSGSIKVDGDLGAAVRLGQLLM